jgi:formylglycine-generating enzyme required for sulfatase activity
VDFLNTLTQTQADTRKYNGSDKRYAITGSTAGSYATTNPYIACPYLSWPDGAAYADWSGLRPMTELEYEKACRGPLNPVANEFAWGTENAANGAYTLGNAGLNNESIETSYSTTAGNTSYYSTVGSIDGPLRVGIYAANSSNTGRITAGASYYGIMELSGNLDERTVTVGNASGRAFTGVHGDGALSSLGYANTTAWPGLFENQVFYANGIGYRGGNFITFVQFLRVSDRFGATLANYTHYSWYGFRAVRSHNQ